MTQAVQQLEVRSHARVAGVVYLSYFAVAILGLLLSSRHLPAGAWMAWPAGALYAAVTILLYRLFRPSQPLLALAAALCSLTGCVADGLHQLHVNSISGETPLLFFGPFCILLGVLILRSSFLPHWLGWPLIVAGIGWLAYLIPAVAQHGKVVIFPIGFVAEFELMVWLLLRGVDEVNWKRKWAECA